MSSATSYKTRLGNLLRKLFKIPLLERWLVRQIDRTGNAFFLRLVPSEQFYKKGSLRAINKNGINYNLDISNIVDNYIYFGVPDRTFDSVVNKIKEARVILDVGANIGSTALMFARLNPNAVIYAFEPHNVTYKRALRNISINKFKNIELIQKGLGEQPRVVKLYEVAENNPGANRILEEGNDYPSTEIEIDTIDNIVRQKNLATVDFIKMDVEGYEFSVLKGAINTLLKYHPVLHIELDNGNLQQHNLTANMLLNFLIDAGYTNIYRADDLKKITPEDNLTDCHCNIIASAA